MQKSLLLLAVAAGALLLPAVEIPVRTGKVDIIFQTKGGGIDRITRDGKVFTCGKGSFTERVMGDTMKNGKPAQFQEQFENLEFEAKFLKRWSSEAVLSFSARGIGAFDWLRIDKVYTVRANPAGFSVKYTLTNLDTKPHSTSPWTRTFLRSHHDGNPANVYLQPRTKGVAELRHPGPSIRDDEWSVMPPLSWSAVYDPQTGRGAIVTFPEEKPASLYSWYSLKKHVGTLEFIPGTKELQPGKSVSYTVNVILTDNVPAELKKPYIAKLAAVKAPAHCSYYPSFHIAGKERDIPFFQTPGGNLPRSANFMRLTIPKQYTKSVREVILPPQVNPETCAVYVIANDRADYSREVPSAVVKGADGTNRLLFAVPDLGGVNFHAARFFPDGSCRHVDGAYMTQTKFDVEIAFDRVPAKKLDLKGFDKGANLIYNGSFTVPNASPKLKGLPDGFHDNFYGSRLRWYAWKDGVLIMNKPSNEAVDKWVQFGPYFVLEKDMKYTVSMKIRNDNKIKGVAVGSISFYDVKGKEIRKQQLRFYNEGSTTHDWKLFTREFYTPAGAAFARLSFHLYGLKDQTLYFDDIQVVPRPYSGVRLKLVDRLRDQLKSSWYKPLDYIERNSAAETPHVKWMRNAAFTMPEVLFLPVIRGTYSKLERRVIVELAQRMDLKYKMIPLLRKVSYINGSGVMDVYANTFENGIETYTHERLKELASIPKVCVINAVSFKDDSDPDFVKFLEKAVKSGSKLFFLNCKGTPVKLLGKQQGLPKDLLQIPRMRNLSPGSMSSWIRLYENGAELSTSPGAMNGNPAVPGSELKNRYPSPAGRDFPFMEYTYLAAARVLRHLAGVRPEARILSAVQQGNTARFKIDGKAAGTTLKTAFRWGNELFALPDVKGGVESTVSLASLPEGRSVLEYRLADAQGKALDAGAMVVDKPKVLNLVIKGDRKNVKYGSPVTFSAQADSLPAGASLRVRIEDHDRRVVCDRSVKARELQVKFEPAFPLSPFYRIIATVETKDRVPARALGEFVLSGLPLDPTELTPLAWTGSDSVKYPIYRKVGFKHLIVWCRDNAKGQRAILNLGLMPTIFGLGGTADSYANWTPYKDDKATDNTVRNPCFSDPKVCEKATKNIRKLLTENEVPYYGTGYYLIGDEQFIGSTVCFSPHCLARFRDSLKTQYGSLDALNAAWGTAFKKWEEVTPVQSRELKDRKRLGAWLDHKIFMNNVFAHSYVGHVRKAIRSVVPGARTGLSGTYNPGPTYEWKQLMKEMDYLAYYNGIQRKLAQDFGGDRLVGGQWYGGYVLPVPKEGYCGTYFWQGFLIGANMSAVYIPRAGITGDLQLTPVLQCYDRLLRESNQGLGKLILSSKETPEIAVLYSQRSLFACTGTIGANEWQNTNSGWHALLNDLGTVYRFIDKEILEDSGVDKRFKVLILPGAISLSDKEIARITEFAAAGGTVIADMTPGLYDDHGVLRKANAFTAKFGTAAPATPALSQVKAECKGNASGIPAVKGDFRTIDPKAVPFTVTPVGKGKFVGVNLLVSGYQAVLLGGTGGETSKTVSGAEVFCRNWRLILEGLLRKAGVAPHRVLTDAKGRPYQAESCWRSNGGNHVLGLLKPDPALPVVDPKKGDAITAKIPVKGHVYDLRAKKYLGYTDTFKLLLSPARGEFFSVMKEKVAKVELLAPARVTRGGILKFSAKAVTASGKSAGSVVFHWELKSPAGKVCDRAAGNLLSTPEGKIEFAFQTAFNDAKGPWQLTVSCVNACVSSSAKVVLE